MRALAATVLFFAAGLINFLPISGVLSASQLETLYGVRIEGTDLLILMRHRAVLLGIVGGLLMAAAFHRPLRPLGLLVGLISMLSFLLIAAGIGGYGAPIRRVVLADVAACVLLVGGAVLSRRTRA